VTPLNAREHRTDAILCLILAAASIAYLMLRPVALGSADEAYYFYHAVRMLGGEALYRDVYELTTPFLMDVLALAFHLFGATLATGRAVGSVIQALLVVAIFRGARAVGAGRALAIALAMVQLSIGQSAWPYTTPHWLAVLLVCTLLLLSLDRQRARTAGAIVLQGLVLGLLLATRQHAGMAVGLGMVLLAFADALNDRLWQPEQGLPLGRRLVLLALATLAGCSLVLGPHLVQAGFAPMFSQLVIHPLTGYRDTIRVEWGTNYLFEHASYTWPALLKYLPIVVAITALRAAVAWLRRADRRTTETRLVLAVFGGSAIAFTMSYPDAVHLAMILPVILIVAGELILAALRAAGRWSRGAQGVLGLAVIVACTVQLQRNYTGARVQFPILHATEFGLLPFARQRDIDAVEGVKRALAQSPGRELFVYSGWSAIYLMAGAHNPTRHEVIYPEYQTEEEIQAVIETLERKRVRHVILMEWLIKPGDPVHAYVTRHYRCTDIANVPLCERHDGQ